jgi:hypothetical protein
LDCTTPDGTLDAWTFHMKGRPIVPLLVTVLLVLASLKYAHEVTFEEWQSKGIGHFLGLYTFPIRDQL